MTEAQKKEILEEAIKKIGEYLTCNKPHLFAIDDLVMKAPDGELNLTLRVYKGFVTDIVTGKQITRMTFKRSGKQTLDLDSNA